MIVSAGGDGGGDGHLPHQHGVAPAGDLAMRGTSERPAAEGCNHPVVELAAMRGNKHVFQINAEPTTIRISGRNSPLSDSDRGEFNLKFKRPLQSTPKTHV